MKTKLSKILGVSLAVMLVFGLVFALVPTKQAEAVMGVTPNQWNTVTIPTVVGNVLRYGSRLADIAVGSDGTTVWAVDDGRASAGVGVFRSDDSGNTFTQLTNFPGTRPILVACAPDNPEVVAVVDCVDGISLGTVYPYAVTTADVVYLSKNGGSTWSVLPATGALAGAAITGIDVGPERAATFLGRDIIVSVGDPAAATYGNVYLVGESTTWQGVGVAGASFDYMDVQMAPNWGGSHDFVTLAVGTNALAVASVFFVVQEFVTSTPLSVLNLCAIDIAASVVVPTITAPAEWGAVNGVYWGSVSLPSDADYGSPFTSAGYVAWDSALAAGSSDDAYYVSGATGVGATVRKLGIPAGARPPVYDIDFAGTTTGGVLFASVPDPVWGAQVWHTEDPTVAMPTWSYSYKWPTGTLTTAVEASPDFSETGKVYASSTGANCGFSYSPNAGVSYNQTALIDINIATLRDVMPTPDNSTVFLSTDNTTLTAQLWRSTVPTTNATWERVNSMGANPYTTVPFSVTQNYFIRLSAYYGTEDFAVYWVHSGNRDIWKSPLMAEFFGGAKQSPTGTTIIDLTLENQGTFYLAANNNLIYKTTDSGASYSLGVAANCIPYSIAMAPSYPYAPEAGNVLVGGTLGEVTLTRDGAATPFERLLPYANAATNMQVLAHKDYATNNLVFAGSRFNAYAGGGIYRYTVDQSAEWEQMLTAFDYANAGGTATVAGLPQISGLGMHCGNLYASWFEAVNTGTEANSGAFRSIDPFPTWAMPQTNFDVLDVGAVAVATRFNVTPSALRVAGNDTEVWLWSIDGASATPILLAYTDTMAKAGPEVTGVPTNVAYDPNTQSNAAFSITWNPLSNATQYDIYFSSDPEGTNIVATLGATAVPGTVEPAGYPNTFTPAIGATPSATVPSLTAGGAQMLPPGNDYYLWIRARNQASGDWIISPFAAPIKITVEIGVPISAPGVGPVLTSPEPGSTTVDAVDVTFSWGSMLNATEYEFILATDSALQNTIAGTPAYVGQPAFGPVTLDYGQSYFYAVKVTKPSVSPQSIASFSTIAVPAEKYTCQYCGLTFDTRAELEAHIAAVHAPTTPLYIWIVIAVGAILVIVVIWLIFSTRRA